jgi:hypothetical protein
MRLTPQTYIEIVRASYDLLAAQQQLQIANARLADLLSAQGLDSARPLRYNDHELTIEPVEAAGGGE